MRCSGCGDAAPAAVVEAARASGVIGVTCSRCAAQVGDPRIFAEIVEPLREWLAFVAREVPAAHAIGFAFMSALMYGEEIRIAERMRAATERGCGCNDEACPAHAMRRAVLLAASCLEAAWKMRAS